MGGKLKKTIIEKYIPGTPGVPSTPPTPAIPANPGQPYKAGYYKQVWVDEPATSLPNLNTNNSGTNYNNTQPATQKIVYVTAGTIITKIEPNTIYIYVNSGGSTATPWNPPYIFL